MFHYFNSVFIRISLFIKKINKDKYKTIKAKNLKAATRLLFFFTILLHMVILYQYIVKRFKKIHPRNLFILYQQQKLKRKKAKIQKKCTIKLFVSFFEHKLYSSYIGPSTTSSHQKKSYTMLVSL